MKKSAEKTKKQKKQKKATGKHGAADEKKPAALPVPIRLSLAERVRRCVDSSRKAALNKAVSQTSE
jgi:hypothetical protein